MIAIATPKNAPKIVPDSLRFTAELAFVELAALALEVPVVEELDFAMLFKY
jgi:hypothetical protein